MDTGFHIVIFLTAVCICRDSFEKKMHGRCTT